ncbi:GTP cyclohydrolase II [Sediminicoccus sp. KRV36]|uniref:GTP cyclohydrolase II n=1 Tax=Sediminicoccus sp. KRV36 TaxID=3133721 RepID=UPI002010AE2A|nr:GTP cyclohydrolase II [Sediminicoccus rosea]UPY36635.1 GTP cyclohydrolase II [Sediminicoccus rosea]
MRNSVFLPSGQPAQRPASAETLALRAVHRAVSDLRRGTPVIIEGDGAGLLVAAAETVGAQGLAEIMALASAAPLLLLSPVRASSILQRPVPLNAPDEGAVALRLPAGLTGPERLRAFADPTAELLLGPEGATAGGTTAGGAALERAPLPHLAPAALSLAKLGRLLPALVAAPIMPGHAAEGLLRVSAADLLAYPASIATSLRRVGEARVPLEDAPETRIIAFRAADGGIEHLAMLVGDPEAVLAQGGTPLARLHSECFTGDLLGSLRCDCGPQLKGALRRMAEDGSGILLYLAQEGRGIGLVNKLRAYTLQDQGLDTLDANRALGYGADERNFLVAATMLRLLGVPRVRLLTNNPDKIAGLAACGVEIVTREQHAYAGNGVNDRYLATKAERFGHMLEE